MCDPSVVQTLELQYNKIGDAGVTALANACASGSLASLKTLIVGSNAFGEAAREKLKAVCSARSIEAKADIHTAL